MKLVAIAALFVAALGTVGCKDPGEAYADAVCACSDEACFKKANADHAEKFPESAMNLGQIEKLPEDKKKHIGRAMECMMKAAKK